MSTTGRGRGIDERESPLAPPIPSFASLRAPRRSSPAMDLLAPPPVAELPLPPVPAGPVVPLMAVPEELGSATTPPASFCSPAAVTISTSSSASRVGAFVAGLAASAMR